MIGLKENVIIGKLIPAGTGMKRYRNAKLSTDNDLMGTIDFAMDEDMEVLDEETAGEALDEVMDASVDMDDVETDVTTVEESDMEAVPEEVL